jgi:ABC-type branched-subunit amino acid transport system substrate-binding protein
MWPSAVEFGTARAGRILALGLAFLAVLLLSACNSVAPVVKVGLVAPFEGREREIGYDVLYSARLAVREINAAGGIGGTRVALVALDDGGDAEFAAATADSLLIDPQVVAVVGHWLPETTAVARPRYEAGGLTFLAGGEAPFAATDPALLSDEFVAAYTAVTPFDEVPGPFAGPAYDAFQVLWQLLAQAEQQAGTIDRDSVHAVAKLREEGQ